jgi:hypothetical protein
MAASECCFLCGLDGQAKLVSNREEAGDEPEHYGAHMGPFKYSE